jgi:hypothetical protein
VVASNRRLGESFEAVPDVDPETPAGHFLAAGILDKAGRYSVQAADRAAHKLAFARAADLYRQAMGCFPQDNSLITKCADALVNAGRCAESAPLYLSAAAADPERAFQLKTRAAEQLLASGRIEDGLGVLKPLLADVGIRYPKTPLRALFRRSRSRSASTSPGRRARASGRWTSCAAATSSRAAPIWRRRPASRARSRAAWPKSV